MRKLLFNVSTSKDLFFLLLNKSILYVFPFILIPLIITKVGLDSYGQYVTAQSAGLFFSSFITFGFEIYGIKNISKLKSYSKSNYINNLFTLQVSLLLTVCLVLFLIYLLLKLDLVLYILLSTVIASREILYTPIVHIAESKSYFIGIKNSLERACLICILFFIPFQINVTNILLFHTAIVLLTGGINYYWQQIRLKWDLNFFKKAYFQNNKLIFSKFISTLKDRVSVFLIGITFGFNEVAYLDIGQKFINLLSFPTTAINQYGLANHKKQKSFLNNLLRLSIGTSLLLGIPFLFLSKIISTYFGLDVNSFKSMNLYIIIGALSLSGGSIVGINGLLSNSLNKEYLKVMIFTTAFYFLFLITEAFFDLIPYNLLIIIPATTYLFEYIFRSFMLKK